MSRAVIHKMIRYPKRFFGRKVMLQLNERNILIYMILIKLNVFLFGKVDIEIE